MNLPFPDIHTGDDQPQYSFWSGHAWEHGASGETVEVKNPTDGSVIARFPKTTNEEIDAGMKTVTEAQIGWAKRPLNERINIIKNAAQKFRENEKELTELLMWEIGKTRSDAKSEIIRSAEIMEYMCAEATCMTGDFRDSDSFPGFASGRLAFIDRAPHGVILAIAPFNYPVNLAISKIAPALLMGNGVVFKSPTQGTLSGLSIVKLFLDAGVPGELLFAPTGAGHAIGDYLVAHPRVSMIAFTGSSEVGAKIAAKTTMIPLLFECGGNNPSIVFPDADMGKTATEIVKGAFSYSGQRCTAIKYVLARSEVMDQIIPLVGQKMDELINVGQPFDEATKMVGPLISEEAAKTVEEAVNDAKNNGAEVYKGGNRHGSTYEPTVLKNVRPDLKVVRIETFGPVVNFITVSDEDEALCIINNSHYGLQASVFTKDEGTGMKIGRQIHVGTVQINGSPQRGPDHFPFMGIKGSGVGVQGIRYSLEAMSRLRSIVFNNPE